MFLGFYISSEIQCHMSVLDTKYDILFFGDLIW